MYPKLAIVVFGAFFLFIFALLLVAILIIQGLGLYKMAKNARLNHPWISFLYPTYNMSLLAQRSLYFHTGKKRNLARWSILLLVFAILFAVLTGVLAGWFINQLPVTSYSNPYYYRYFENGNAFAYYGYGPNLTVLTLDKLVFMLVITLPAVLVGVVSIIFNGYVLYYIYKDYCPRSVWVMLLVSLLFGAWPIIFLVVRNVVPVSVAGYYPYGQPKYGRVPPAAYCGDAPVDAPQGDSQNYDPNEGDTHD